MIEFGAGFYLGIGLIFASGGGIPKQPAHILAFAGITLLWPAFLVWALRC